MQLNVSRAEKEDLVVLDLEGQVRVADVRLYRLPENYVAPEDANIPDKTKNIYTILFRDDENGQVTYFHIPNTTTESLEEKSLRKSLFPDLKFASFEPPNPFLLPAFAGFISETHANTHYRDLDRELAIDRTAEYWSELPLVNIDDFLGGKNSHKVMTKVYGVHAMVAATPLRNGSTVLGPMAYPSGVLEFRFRDEQTLSVHLLKGSQEQEELFIGSYFTAGETGTKMQIGINAECGICSPYVVECFRPPGLDSPVMLEYD